MFSRHYIEVKHGEATIILTQFSQVKYNRYQYKNLYCKFRYYSPIRVYTKPSKRWTMEVVRWMMLFLTYPRIDKSLFLQFLTVIDITSVYNDIACHYLLYDVP